MKYVAISVPQLQLGQDGESRPKAPPVAHVGLSLQHSRRAQTGAWDFEFEIHSSAVVRNRRKKRRNWLASFLSLGLTGSGQRYLMKTFREIDSDNRGVIGQADLERYARKNNMPTDYVGSFFSKMKETAPAGDVTFEDFSRHVSSREEALRRSFGIFDVGGDGRIDVDDLELALQHTRVCCPKSRCTYKCRKGCIRDLLAKVDRNNDKQIEFWEFRKYFMMVPQNYNIVDYWLSANCSERCDVGGCVVIHDGDKYAGRKTKETNPWGHLFAGAFAGAASRTATAPLETIRLNAMTGAIPADLNPVQAARRVCDSAGWKSLYKGNLTNVIRSAPQKALDFFAFDAFKKLLGGEQDVGIVKTFVAAGLAGATSNFTLYPLEVIRSRLTVDTAGKYKGVLDAFQKIAKNEGVAGLYHGVGPSVAAILPEAAIVYGLFDLSKKTYSRATGKEPGLLTSLSFGVWSAFMGQVVAYPLETVSRRMQVQGMKTAAGGSRYGFSSCLNDIVSKEGVAGLYRGLGAASARVIPMAIVSFGTYELIRLLVRQAEDALDRHEAEQERRRLHHQCRHLTAATS